jgi:hypothetical protein
VLRLVAASQRDDPADEHLAEPLLAAIRSLAQALELRGFVLAPIENDKAAMPPVPFGWTLE